jgi:O-antigen ligase
LLKRHFPFSINLAHISLTFVGLMWVLPFLYYYHAYPLTTFYQEWGAGMLGLCAMPLLLTARYWREPEVPRIVLLPIGLLLLLMVQFFVGRMDHFDQLMLVAMYFMFAALLMMLGQCLRQELGLPALATVLAVFLLVGAELNTAAGILQHYQWNTFLNPVVTVKISSAVYGNTAQPNHYADYLALGLISLGLLYAGRSLRSWQVALLAAPMLFVMVLSGSRSSWLYLLGVAGLAFLWQRRDGSLRSLWHYSLALVLGFGLMHLVVQIPWLQGATGSITTTERLLGDNASGGIRLHLWREAALMFARFPLLGAGFGQFAYQHLQLAAELRNPAITGLYNNAHNLVMQIAAEAGLAGLAVLLGSLGLWFWHAIVRGARFTLHHWWGYAILAVLAVHSLLEYPLWYAYFLGVAAFLLGMFDATTHSLELRTVGRVAVGAMLLLGLVSLVQELRGYRQLERALALHRMVANDTSFTQRKRDQLMAVYDYPLLTSYADLFIANTLEPSSERLSAKLRLNERALHFVPLATLAYHQAWLLALSDRPAEARTQLQNAIWAYPAEYATARTELDELVRKDPARFSALLESAIQIYEEYRSAAVPAK